MPDDEIKLTMVQRSVLLALMAEAREVPNAELTKLGMKLDAGYRNKLKNAGLIIVRAKGSRGPYFFELTDLGWRWCQDQMDADVPPKMGSGGVAAYVILANLKRGLAHAKISLPEFFARSGEFGEPAPVEPVDVETRIRKAYAELAPRPGAPVRLADLRRQLGELARSEVDEALVLMDQAPDVSVEGQSDQKRLTDSDHAAAVRIGNHHNHLIVIGPS